MIKGYKFFNEGFKSNYGNMYEVGKTYAYDREIELCYSGFHFSRKLEDSFKCYCVSAKHCCIVESSGETIEDDDKIVCSEIYIKEELDFNNVLLELSRYNGNLKYVVLNKNCPEDILRNLYKNKDLKLYIALNESCPNDILKELSNSKNWKIRYAVAKNNNCPADILEKLSEDKIYMVKINVACNKNSSGNILRKLHDNNNDFRGYIVSEIISHNNCPKDIKLLYKIS